MITKPYALEQLFTDQDRDWVADTIAPVMAWVPGRSRKRAAQPFRFEIEHTQNRKTLRVAVDLTWDETRLETLLPGVRAHAQRLRGRRSAQREHVTELAAYGLTFVTMAVLMPGVRVLTMQAGVAPDILFDVAPGALRGVETAGRATGGRTALLTGNGSPATPKSRPRAGKGPPCSHGATWPRSTFHSGARPPGSASWSS